MQEIYRLFALPQDSCLTSEVEQLAAHQKENPHRLNTYYGGGKAIYYGEGFFSNRVPASRSPCNSLAAKFNNLAENQRMMHQADDRNATTSAGIIIG